MSHRQSVRLYVDSLQRYQRIILGLMGRVKDWQGSLSDTGHYH